MTSYVVCVCAKQHLGSRIEPILAMNNKWKLPRRRTYTEGQPDTLEHVCVCVDEVLVCVSDMIILGHDNIVVDQQVNFTIQEHERWTSTIHNAAVINRQRPVFAFAFV